MISRGYAVRHILFVEISRKTGYDLIRGRDVVKCHDLFLWRNTEGPAPDTLDETLPTKKIVYEIHRPSAKSRAGKCVKLNYVKAMFTDYLSAGTTRDWLAGVSYKGTFVKSYDAHWNMKECGIPKSWDLERN